MRNNLLPLLGLCFRARSLAVGEEPVDASVRARYARLLLLAADAADNTVRRTRRFAESGGCPWLRTPFSKAELGRAVGRSSAAILAVTDIGLAANIARRLAAEDEAQYGETAALLEKKNLRAAERKAEKRAHEKNVRQGRPRKKALPERASIQPEAPPKKAAGRSGASRTKYRPARSGPPAAAGNRRRNSRPVKKGKGSFRKRAAGPKS